SGGQVSGTPSQAGTFSSSVQAKASSGSTATANFSVAVSASAHVEITTTSLPSGAVGVSYSATLSAANGVAPYTWTMANGQLPPGLSLQSGGQVSGTPSRASTFSFSVQATDS